MRILITGPAAAFDEHDEPITATEQLASLHGREYSEELISSYFDEKLDRIGVTGGGLRLVFDDKQGQLSVVAEFLSPRKLKPKELELLVEETTGQWSDGIGGQGVFDDDEVQVDLSPTSDQPLPAVAAEQIDDSGPVKKPRKSPLFNLAAKGDVAKLLKRLDACEDPNARDKHGFMPLHTAISNQQTAAALLLIERGADLEAFDGMGACPLTVAARCGELAVGKALLERGVDINRHVPGDGSESGYVPLIMACNQNQFAFAQLLIEHGADVNINKYHGYTPLLMLDPEGLEEEELEPMVAVARLLLERGADPEAKVDRQGLHPLLKERLQL